MQGFKNWMEQHPKAAQWIREGGLFLLFSYVVTFIKMLLLMFLPSLFHYRRFYSRSFSRQFI